MTFDLYAFCWNEVELVPLFLDHYGPLCRRIVVFDDGSDDGSAELLTAHPKVEVRPLGAGDSYVARQTELSNTAWRESVGSADWVGIVAVDELIGPDLETALERHATSGATVLRPTGYDLVSETFPPSQAPCGVQNPFCSKPCLFDCRAVESVSVAPGNHWAEFAGRVALREPAGLYLHHLRYLGRERTWARFKTLDARRRAGDRAHGWGGHYEVSRPQFDAHFDHLLGASVPLERVFKAFYA